MYGECQNFHWSDSYEYGEHSCIGTYLVNNDSEHSPLPYDDIWFGHWKAFSLLCSTVLPLNLIFVTSTRHSLRLRLSQPARIINILGGSQPAHSLSHPRQTTTPAIICSDRWYFCRFIEYPIIEPDYLFSVVCQNLQIFCLLSRKIPIVCSPWQKRYGI